MPVSSDDGALEQPASDRAAEGGGRIGGQVEQIHRALEFSKTFFEVPFSLGAPIGCFHIFCVASTRLKRTTVMPVYRYIVVP